MRPENDIVEVTLIGPGYGECVLVHLGGGYWIIIDSCLDSESGQPASLAYLESIGVQPSESVCMIVASHWHDDHIRGMAATLRQCTKAIFCCSTAMTSDEFIAAVTDYESRNMLAGRSGVREISEVYKILLERPSQLRTPRWAMANRPVLSIPNVSEQCRSKCNIFSLSPSDSQIQKFFNELGELIPSAAETKCRVVPQSPNHLSTVIWIEFDEFSMLFGADLEETSDEGAGWSVIVNSNERPEGKAIIFKVPHHGSANGHNQEVWDRMLAGQPYAIICPYNKGTKKLPSQADVERVLGLTDNAYITSNIQKSKSRKQRSRSVERGVQKTVGKLWEAEPRSGRITLRNNGAVNPAIWNVDLSPSACNLSELQS